MTAQADDMPTAEAAIEPSAPRRGRRWPWVLAGLMTVLVIALGVLWSQRKPIAVHYVDNLLARKRVPARYHIADLGLGRQRLTDLVIGDPAHPDLVADWVEVETDIGLGGVHVTGLRAGHVRMRGKLVNGHLSLGAIDRLLPPPSGKPFALPAINVAVQDARMRLEAPQGVIGLKVSGSGRLDNGFSGQLAAVAETLDLGQCVTGRMAATVSIRIADAQPTISGPMRTGTLTCGDTRLDAASADIDATLGDRLDRWQGKAKLAVGRLTNPSVRLADVGGTVSFDGSPARTAGAIDLEGGHFAATDVGGAGLAMSGGYRVENGFIGFQGTASAKHAALSQAWLDRIAAATGAAAGTPIGPLLAQLAKAGVAAGQSLSVDANIDAVHARGAGRIGVSRLMVGSATGASLTLSDGDGIQYDWPAGGLRIDGLLALSGGGLPEAAVRLAQDAPHAPMTGTAIVRPFRAGDARLALTPVAFTAGADGLTRFSTQVTLSGPLGDGRVDNATLPVSGTWNGAGRLAINEKCAPLTFDRLTISGLMLARSRLALCPRSGALVSIDGSRLDGGARLVAPRLAGTLGGTPLTLAASGSEVRLADKGFAVAGLAVRIGRPDAVTRLDFGTLDGRLDGSAIAGTFADTGGQIGNVPIVMSKANGSWRLVNGVLDVSGGTTVSDAAESPRFNPLVSKDVALKLAHDVITATGTLANPDTGIKVTDVSIEHDLGKGAGHAELAVPGITFGDALQPDKLTPLTYGVIADVKGTVSGEGHIRWNPAGVTSTGTFKTAGADLAAAFGPVTGLSTEIHFTDLLNMVSAPDQTATVAEINPGVAVDNGVVHYQTLSSTQVKVLGAEWPFSGGTLTLDPTLLDFGEGQARRLTFRVKGMDAAQFIQKFDFKNLDATGIFDGELPMVFDINGGRIENGHLKVRPGGGTIAYVGDLSQKDLGTWGNMAFQALKSLRYDALDITMNGPLSGEMVTQVRFSGVHQGKGTKSNFLVKRLTKLPFVFNVTIRAPFRQLISSAESLYDPSKLPTDQLQQLIKQEKDGDQSAPDDGSPATTPPEPPIQHPESETMP